MLHCNYIFVLYSILYRDITNFWVKDDFLNNQLLLKPNFSVNWQKIKLRLLEEFVFFLLKQAGRYFIIKLL